MLLTKRSFCSPLTTSQSEESTSIHSNSRNTFPETLTRKIPRSRHQTLGIDSQLQEQSTFVVLDYILLNIFTKRSSFSFTVSLLFHLFFKRFLCKKLVNVLIMSYNTLMMAPKFSGTQKTTALIPKLLRSPCGHRTTWKPP